MLSFGRTLISASKKVSVRAMSSTATDDADSRDHLFHLYEVLKVDETLGSYAEYENSVDREMVESILETSSKIAQDTFANHSRRNDENEPSFDGKTVTIEPLVSEALSAFYGAGLGAAHASEEHGGMNLPSCVSNSAMFRFYAANVGTSTFPFLTIAAGNMLSKYGTPEQLDEYYLKMLNGSYSGTMNLSETQAGSSLGDITTKAYRVSEAETTNSEGTNDRMKYKIKGTKMWISGGEHELNENIVHMVLAKVVDPETNEIAPGVKGISLFVVPKKRSNRVMNDIQLGGLNHKMGWRGATNCTCARTRSPCGERRRANSPFAKRNDSHKTIRRVELR